MGDEIYGDGRAWCPPEERCAWCEVRARAVPDEPPILWEGAWYHRRGCYPAARLKAGGYLPADYAPASLVEWSA